MFRILIALLVLTVVLSYAARCLILEISAVVRRAP